MNEHEKIRRMIAFRCSPLLDMALSLVVLQNPERFGGAAPWMPRVLERLPEGLLERLREMGERTDLFAVAMDLEDGPSLPATDAIGRLRETDPALASDLLTYWAAISPEVAAKAGLLAESVQKEPARLARMDPPAFIRSFSDRVEVTGDGKALVLHWGRGLRVPLEELKRILFVPSAFCPRRLMFYRLGPVQIFFYDPLHEEPAVDGEAPESLILGFSALADPTRLKLLRLVARETLPAQEMARRLGVNESTVSRHLRLLVEAGLVGRDRQEGKYVYYSFEPARIDRLARMAKAYLGKEGGAVL